MVVVWVCSLSNALAQDELPDSTVEDEHSGLQIIGLPSGRPAETVEEAPEFSDFIDFLSNGNTEETWPIIGVMVVGFILVILILWQVFIGIYHWFKNLSENRSKRKSERDSQDPNKNLSKEFEQQQEAFNSARNTQEAVAKPAAYTNNAVTERPSKLKESGSKVKATEPAKMQPENGVPTSPIVSAETEIKSDKTIPEPEPKEPVGKGQEAKKTIVPSFTPTIVQYFASPENGIFSEPTGVRDRGKRRYRAQVYRVEHRIDEPNLAHFAPLEDEEALDFLVTYETGLREGCNYTGVGIEHGFRVAEKGIAHKQGDYNWRIVYKCEIKLRPKPDD